MSKILTLENSQTFWGGEVIILVSTLVNTPLIICITIGYCINLHYDYMFKCKKLQKVKELEQLANIDTVEVLEYKTIIGIQNY